MAIKIALGASVGLGGRAPPGDLRWGAVVVPKTWRGMRGSDQHISWRDLAGAGEGGIWGEKGEVRGREDENDHENGVNSQGNSRIKGRRARHGNSYKGRNFGRLLPAPEPLARSRGRGGSPGKRKVSFTLLVKSSHTAPFGGSSPQEFGYPSTSQEMWSGRSGP